VGAAMGWDERQTAAARDRFDTEREAFLRKPAVAIAQQPAASV
jgi:hypothetical protein